MKYVSHEIGTDMYGKRCVIIYYDYTNNAPDKQSALWSTMTVVTQNGIECGTAFMRANVNTSMDAYFFPVAPGATARVAEAFLISDLSDITVKVFEYMETDSSQTVTLKLQ